MTTESKPQIRTGSPLLGALGSGTVAVVVLVGLAALVDGRAAVVGAATGGVLTLAVFALGIAMVALVARVMPSASLLVALLTYLLQLLALAVCVAVIERAGIGEETLARPWFAAGVIAVTLLWLAGQLVTATRQRIPAYDLPSETPAPSASGTPHDGVAVPPRRGELVDHPGGER